MEWKDKQKAEEGCVEQQERRCCRRERTLSACGEEICHPTARVDAEPELPMKAVRFPRTVCVVYEAVNPVLSTRTTWWLYLTPGAQPGLPSIDGVTGFAVFSLR